MISGFKGKYDFLSNFYDCLVEYDGDIYSNAESAYQAAKTDNYAERQKFANLSGSEAKKLGKKLKLRANWEKIKDDVMYQVCFSKFTMNPDLQERLLETGDETLREDNLWGDAYWGCFKGIGKNKLGKILMEIRDVLRK